MRRWLLIICAGALALAQTPTSPPAISAFYRDVQGTNPWKWIVIDPPLILTIDSAGVPHLGLAASSLSTITAGDLVTASAPVP